MPLNLPAPLDHGFNGWHSHNIAHSSPSSINMWSNAPCAWVAKYLLKREFKFSNAARAGVLAEEAVVNTLARGWTQDDATAAALAEYSKATAFGASDADRKRGEAITGMISQAVGALKEYGDPEFDNAPDAVIGKGRGKDQKKIELLCKGDGWDLPVWGFLDFWYPQHGLCIDLKTTMRLPSEMSDEHLRQGCIYRAALGNAAVKFLYVSGKDKRLHDVPEPSSILSEVKAILTRQERFLRLGAADMLQGFVPVNAGSFYWTGDEDTRKELYGI